jgi:hypothetical protein
MKIFTYYTGNAFINNALMTIEALMKANSLDEVTTTKLIELFHEPIKGFSLLEINLMMKNYTMIFGRNSLLCNYDNKIKGDAYNKLMLNIFNGYECDGDNVCAISGLRFNRTFETFMKEMLIEIDPSGAQKKDITINRGWFPLIGGLGSDAQALPQAQFTYKIHPICIAILQFLPLSSLVYKRGLLLVDSCNYSFARRYVAENVNKVKERIEFFTYEQQQIDNIKDTKGNYLLKAIDLIAKMEDLYGNYFDLNLWSYSNSGTGANCEIDRIPNEFLRKLVRLRQKSAIGEEVKRILCDKNANSFIEAFQNKEDWWGLYPTSKYKGVSPEFFEAYYEEIGLGYKIQYAKYIAYLISKYQTKSFGKYLKKSDAYENNSYHIDLYSVFFKATEEGLWDWKHQIKILDVPNQLPLILSYKALHQVIHFFYQAYKSKDFPIKQIEDIDETEIQYNVTWLCNWLVSLIFNDSKSKRLVKDLKNLSYTSYSLVSFHSLFLRNAERESVNMDVIFSSFYTNEGKYTDAGIKKLLRIYFSQSDEEKKEKKEVNWEKKEVPNDFKSWFEVIDNFAYDYIVYRLYRLTKNTEFAVDAKTYDRLWRDISDIPNDNRFIIWIEDVINKLNDYQEENKRMKWNEEDLLYNPLGERSVSFASFLIRLSFKKIFYKHVIKK